MAKLKNTPENIQPQTTDVSPDEGEQSTEIDTVLDPGRPIASLGSMLERIAELERERDEYKERADCAYGLPAGKPGPMLAEIDLPAGDEARRLSSFRPTIDVLLRDLPPGYTPRELEQLAAGILKKAGHAGKSPTGKHVAKHGFLRDILDEKTQKPIRVGPGEVLDDLSPEEIAHLTKHKAIEPEYA